MCVCTCAHVYERVRAFVYVRMCACVHLYKLVVRSVEQPAKSIDTLTAAWLRKNTKNWASSVDESLNKILYYLTCIAMNLYEPQLTHCMQNTYIYRSMLHADLAVTRSKQLQHIQ